MKTRKELKAELLASMEGVSPIEGLPIDSFVEAAVELIIKGRATWDGTHLRLIEGNA